MSFAQLASVFDNDDSYISSDARSRTAFVEESIQMVMPDVTATLPSTSTSTATLESIPNIKKLTPRSFGESHRMSIGYRPFQILQQWEGTVVQSSEDTFVALLIDKTGAKPDEEEVEIELNELSADDKSLVKPGASFYWSIGYEDAPGVPRQRVSRIRFRRLPGWTRREVDRAELAGRRYESLFE